MKIGITGGAGFIGTYVAEYAVNHGHDVTIFDRRGRGPTPFTEQFLGDVNDPTAVSELAAHVDGIIHLAAVLGTKETINNPRPSAATNVHGGLNVLEACVENDIELCYIGVGNYWMDNSYSISKHTLERYIRMYINHRGLRANIVRAVNAYGPRQSVPKPFGPAKVAKITPSFVCRALTGESIVVNGDGEQISDMVHVSDVARALVMALEVAKEGGVLESAVSVGPYPEFSLTVNQVAELVRKTVRTFYPATPQPPITHVPMRPGETPGDRVSADPDTLKQIGMDPASLVPLEKGIAQTVIWFKEHWLPGYLESTDTLVSTSV